MEGIVKKYSDAEKMEIAAELVNTGSTLVEMAEKYGVTPHTIRVWRDKYMPEAFDIRDVAEMSESEIEQRFQTNSTIAKLYAIQRVLTIIPGEKDMGKLTNLLRELKDISNSIDPTQKDTPWTTEVTMAMQKITEQKITILRQNGAKENTD